MANEVLLRVNRGNLAELRCLHGDDSPVVGIFSAPAGCHCFTDKLQALCAQHASKIQSTEPITCVVDFTKWYEH